MTTRWDEEGLAEAPAIALLQKLGYRYAAEEELVAERGSLREVVLERRLEKALRKLNPWLSDDNLSKAVRAITAVQAASLLEANQQAYTALAHGISLEQDLGAGRKSQQVHFIDFAEPNNNEFLVTQQYRTKGARKEIRPDVVCFVNGVPIAVVELKSPTLGDKWQHEALDQFDRYQELSDKYQGIGNPRLFHTVQVTVASCGQAAVYGTPCAPERAYAEWKEPFPLAVEEVAKREGKLQASAQEVLFYGLLAPANLLDVMHNFVVFERDAKTGRTVRKVPRYQQFRAVNKALERVHRARKAKRASERGGVIWHTQGSGKSLTMMWLATKLRRDPAFDNPTLVLVTDRKDLDEQITSTFVQCGFPSPVQAESVRELHRLLSGPGGRTLMTTVQKFQEAGGVSQTGKTVKTGKLQKLSDADNIFVLADEAHRTQYGSLAANMRHALPNASFFGFTGTPIDKKDRSTLEEFGGYIDKYTIEQAVADGATLPIIYEGRLAELRILGSSLDKLFDRVFAERTDEERAAIKKKFATERAIAEAPKRIEAICLDIVEHFEKYIAPNGFKAQIVASSRDAAVTYKETLDRIGAPQSTVLMSGSNKDEARLVKHHKTEDERKLLVERFKKVNDPLKIIVVCDMLLTGFDAPVEQVMYLDSALKEHTLLQAIARTNRTADKKQYGLIVDYWGVSESLQEALQIFAPEDVKGALAPKADELPRLEMRHAAAMRFFVSVKNKNDLDLCVEVLAPEDVRADFQMAFLRFGQSMDMLLPDPRALEYSRDLKWLGKIRESAKARFRDNSIDISDCGDKVRTLIEEAIVADGIQILVKEVSLFSVDFDKKIAALKSDDAKASEMEHAIRHEITAKYDENPAFYASLTERLEQIVADKKAKRLDAAKQLELFEQLKRQAKDEAGAAQNMGLSDGAFAIYGLLGGDHGSEEARRDLAEIIEEGLAEFTGIVDWQQKDDVRRQMRSKVKRALNAVGYEVSKREDVVLRVMDVAAARKGK